MAGGELRQIKERSALVITDLPRKLLLKFRAPIRLSTKSVLELAMCLSQAHGLSLQFLDMLVNLLELALKPKLVIQ